MDEVAVEESELELLLSTLQRHRDVDFSNYARASLKRCVKRHMKLADLSYISEMIPLVIHDDKFYQGLLNSLSVRVSEMFRDPDIFRTIRHKVLPVLKTYPRINIWHVGCATGEEVYSMAIMLLEEGLINKAHLYATDISDTALLASKKAIYNEDKLALFTANYKAAGGRRELSDYYTKAYGSIKLQDFLKDKVTFAYHNLTEDPAFAEVHLVLCRNVLIYFNKSLQNHCLKQFRDSLIYRGWLILGDKETLDGSDIRADFEDYHQKYRIFKKCLPMT